MNRRNKNRLAPAVQAGLRAGRLIPAMLLIVSAHIVITPEARAEIEAGKAEAVFVKTYSKEELNEKMPPNPVTEMDDRIAAELNGLFRRVGSQTSAAKTKAAWEALKTAEPETTVLETSLGALADKPETKHADIDKIREQFSGEAHKATTERVKGGLDFLSSIQAGLSFNLDFGSFFSSGKSQSPQTAETKAKSKAGSVRYGLILKDITPDMKAAGTASLGDDDFQFAGRAEVNWTIGPLTEQESRRIFDIPEDVPAAGSPSDSPWSRIRIPRFAFKGKANPEGIESLTKGKGTGDTSMRFELSQVEGFYTATQRQGFNGKKLAGEHTFRLPTGIGGLAVGRRFDDRFKVVQTSCYNVLIDNRLPSVSVHYLSIEERYKADLGMTIAGHAISVGAQGRAQGTVAKDDQRPERYTIGYDKNL